MKKVYGLLNACLAALVLSWISLPLVAEDKEPLRILTWEGYVTQGDLDNVNQLLAEKGYAYQAEVIAPYAEGAEQMFDIIRGHKCDISFLTLFFIKMELEQTSRLLQPINLESPRLTNVKNLLPNLTQIPMGLDVSGKPLYIPWGGGAYGFYVDRNRVKAADVPVSVNDLWLPQWKNKFSLNKSQEWYNVGLALMSLNKSPFELYNLSLDHNRKEIIRSGSSAGWLQEKLNSLYKNAGHFWQASPEFRQDLLIVSSWGPEITRENQRGGNWQLIPFKEGHMVWLDTINFVKELKGKKLEAAEIFANYFISKKVQSRIAGELSMVAASLEVDSNKQLGGPTRLFKEHMFVPPYDSLSYSIMKQMTDRAYGRLQSE